MSILIEKFQQIDSKADFATAYLEYLSAIMQELDVQVIAQIIDVIEQMSGNGGTLYFFGNGGSAATATHFANDIAINTRQQAIPSINAVSLVDNQAILTAIANDHGYENVFVKQLEGVLDPKDVIFALSVSGNSENILRAVKYARQIGTKVITCSGFDGGQLMRLSDINLHVQTSKGEYGPVEDVFQILDHLIYTFLMLSRFGKLSLQGS